MPLAAAASIYSTERFSLINTTTDFHVFPSYTVLFTASNSAYMRNSFFFFFSVVKAYGNAKCLAQH